MNDFFVQPESHGVTPVYSSSVWGIPSYAIFYKHPLFATDQQVGKRNPGGVRWRRLFTPVSSPPVTFRPRKGAHRCGQNF